MPSPHRDRGYTHCLHIQILRLCPPCISVRWPNIIFILSILTNTMDSDPVVPPIDYMEGPVPVISGNKLLKINSLILGVKKTPYSDFDLRHCPIPILVIFFRSPFFSHHLHLCFHNIYLHVFCILLVRENILKLLQLTTEIYDLGMIQCHCQHLPLHQNTHRKKPLIKSLHIHTPK